MRLRRAGAGDADAIGELFRRSFGTLTFLPTLHTPEEDRSYFSGVVDEQEVWVAEDDHRLLGFAALGEGMLNHLYVEPAEWGRGVGTALFAQTQDRRPKGFRLWTFQRNTAARRFYERLGCRTLTVTDGSGNEEKEPDILYEWLPPE